MQFELTTEYVEQLKEAIAAKNNAFIKGHLQDMHAADIAIVFNQLEINEAHYIYDLLDAEIAPNVLLELEEDRREELLSTFSTKEIAEQIDNMQSDDAADVI